MSGPENKLRFVLKRLLASGEIGRNDAPASVVAVLARHHPEYARKSQAALRQAVLEILGGSPVAAAPPESESLNESLRTAYGKTQSAKKTPSRPANDVEDSPASFAAGAQHSPPEERFSDVAGCSGAVQALEQLLVEPERNAEVFASVGARGPRGVLVHGPSGCGKTLVCRAAFGEAIVAAASHARRRLTYFEASGTELSCRREADRDLRELFQAARDAAPSIIFLDDVDPKAGEATGRRLASALAVCLDAVSEADVKLVCVAASAEAIDIRLRRFGRLEREVAIGAPDCAGREAILAKLTSALPCAHSDLDLDKLARATPGWLGADLAALVAEACCICARRVSSSGEPTRVVASDFDVARAIVSPAFSRTAGFVKSPDVAWTDVGALAEARDELAASILAPISRPDTFAALGVPLPAGVLLYGPPGCGKTLLAKALATESAANFIAVKGPELLDKYVGESERAVRSLFARARASPPCIVFFDEIDSLCPRRGGQPGGNAATASDSSAVTDRIVNQLLTELDGLDARGQLYVVAATNRPELLDPALLRPGRLDKLLFVPLPSLPDRISILRALTRKVALHNNLDLTVVAADPRADGFSGADLAALVRQAGLNALKDADSSCIRPQHFDKALDHVPPSVSPSDAASYESLAHRTYPASSLSLLFHAGMRPRAKRKRSRSLDETASSSPTQPPMSHH